MPYRSTRCRFTEEMYAEFTNSNETHLIIEVSGGQGDKVHPTGTYVIPRAVAIDFMNSKRKLKCWRDYGDWHNANIPADLIQYFTYE